MNVLIVEDEITATKKLESLLLRIRPDIQIVGRFERVKETVKWINSGHQADLAFFDIQLSDDSSFSIFNQCRVPFPVIFVSAYDDYLLQAFEQQTIHYLLKPITENKVREALDKYSHMATLFRPVEITKLTQSSKTLLVRKGINVIPLHTDQLMYCFSSHKITFAKDLQGTVYMLDQSLTDLEQTLGEESFFRVNRQYLVNRKAIRQFHSIDQGKISIDLVPPAGTTVTIGKDNAGSFRKWIRHV